MEIHGVLHQLVGKINVIEKQNEKILKELTLVKELDEETNEDQGDTKLKEDTQSVSNVCSNLRWTRTIHVPTLLKQDLDSIVGRRSVHCSVHCIHD